MKLELYIAKKIYFGKNEKSQNVSTPAVKIAIAGVAIAVLAMILSVAVVFGFRDEVQSKVIGFGGHIQINNYNNNASHEVTPLIWNDSLENKLNSITGVDQIEPFISREGIIKTSDNFQGVQFKGVDSLYDWSFFKKNLIEGNVILSDTISTNQALISQYIAKKLQLKLGGTFLAYFFQEKIQFRKFTIVGIYNTNFENYDKMYVITNMQVLQKLNKWKSDEVSGLELKVDDIDQLNSIKNNVLYEMLTYRDANNNTLFAQSIKEISPYLFDWLSLMDTNVWVIIILMVLVSGFTMSSGLLILILEQTNTIGILKALGYSNAKIRKVFLYVSSFLVLKGMLWGNIITFLFILIQKYTGIIKLDPESYYVSEVPLMVNVGYILAINVSVLFISILMMIVPSYLVTLIKPARSIKFD